MAVYPQLRGQSFSFTHLSTVNGLSDNNVRSMIIDRKGFLWIGTIDGLNVYDGYSVVTYKKEDRPQMASNNVSHLTCDSRNRIWLGTTEGVTWIDEKRNFHRVVLQDSIVNFGCKTIQDTRTYGIVLFTSRGQFYFNEKNGKWEQLTWVPEHLNYNRFHDADPFDEDRIIYATDSLVMVLDYATKKLVYQQPFTAVFSLCRYSEHELAIGQEHGTVLIADMRTHEVTRQYKLTSELNGRVINSTITEVRPAANGDILVGTGFAGLVIINKSGQLLRYAHDPINPSSLGANMTWRVLSGRNGDILVGTSVAGVSISNIYNRQADYLRLMTNGKGDFYDSYVNRMAEDDNQVIWMGALERLIRWDRKKNRFDFYYYLSNPIWTGAQNLEIKAVCIDKKKRVWVSAHGDGVAIFDPATERFFKVPRDTSLGIALHGLYIMDMIQASDGQMWVVSTLGPYTIDPETLRARAFKNDPVLGSLDGKRINAVLEDRKHRIWMASSNGLYCYDRASNRLDYFTTAHGLASNVCYTLYQDPAGQVYVCTPRGFSIISEGRIQTFTRENGLKYDNCEGVVTDSEGKVWIANTKVIIRYDPDKHSMQYFDQSAGLTQEGFRVASYLKSSNGELLWGCRRGITYFYPQQLLNAPSDLRVNIYQVAVNDSSFYIGGNEVVELKYDKNSISFRFTANNLKGAYNIQYRYILEGYEQQWQNGRDIREARYSSLPPGRYIFKVKASTDGINWKDAANELTLVVRPPLWQRWWFVAGAFVLLGVLLSWIVAKRNRQLREKQEELDAEQAINYFASSIYETNSVKAILWDVAKNCIGRLHFEDCVIYLVDHERQVLIQRAAHGPKSANYSEITNPIEIPLGQGITGTVALTGKPEIIPDTTRDPRYIMDMARRYSEITVPIISNGRIWGVIDCEHSKKGFFTQKHLSILTTIASLCANKIVKAKAEAEKARAEAILMDTQQKMADVEMQALRAQMNPHFIFNCLNSINRYIVKSDQATASLYLTRFAKLIRLILDNSNSKSVTLANEMEALRLYIEMESIRFEKKFDYVISVDDTVQPETVYVPPLIIQPYVENAIWHGLLHKETEGHLSIHVRRKSAQLLECVIEDNGIGRVKARELKSKSVSSKKSLGMKLTEDRLSLLNKQSQLESSVVVEDLVDSNGETAGTRVTVKISIDT